jgi:hypothetical protein
MNRMDDMSEDNALDNGFVGFDRELNGWRMR